MKKLYPLLVCFTIVAISNPSHAEDDVSSARATITWTGAGDGTSWNDAANWDSDPSLPGVSDDVVINLAGSNTIITPANITINSFDLSGDNTLILSRNLTTAASSTIGADATLRWEAGVIGGGGVITNSGLIARIGIATTTLQTPGSAIVNDGTIAIEDTGNINVNSGASIINNSIVEIKNGGGSFDTATGNSSFINSASGILRKTTTADQNIFDLSFDNQGGTIDVQMGSIRFTRASTLQGGTYDTTPGSEIILATAVTISGSLGGNDNGQMISATSLIVNTTASLNFANEGFSITGGTLGGGGILTNNEKLNFRESATATIQTSGTSLVNSGTITLSDDGNLNINSGASLQNDGLIEILNASAWIDTANGGSVLVNNAGATIRKAGDTGIAIFDVNFDNMGGTVEVTSGGLDFTRAGNLNGGTYTAAAGTSIDFGATFTLSGTLNGAGAGRVFSSGVLSIPVAATLNFTNNGFEKTASTMRDGGVLTNTGQFRHTSTSTITLNGGTSFDNDGVTSIENTGNFNIDAGSSFQNDGLFELQNPDGWLDTATAASVFINTSSGILQGDTGGINTVDVEFENAGIIDVVSGTLNFTRGLDHQIGGLIQGNGTIDVTTTFTHDGDTGPGASPGILSWTGNWNPNASSSLEIELGGPSPGSGPNNHDLLQVSGSAALDGSINVSLSNGYVPNVGDQFTVMTCDGGCVGSFATLNTNDGVGLQVIVNANDVVLEITGLTQLNLSAVLAGAQPSMAAGAAMRTDLASSGLLPLVDPYGGTVSVPDFSGDRADVVDWVRVELRTDPSTPNSDPDKNKIALLKSDGSIVDLDGVSPLFFQDGNVGGHFPVIHHRNHLSIASSVAVNLTPAASPESYSFLTSSGQAFGTNPMLNINGIWTMWGGDFNGNGEVTSNDFSLGWLPSNGQPSAYSTADFNLDGNFTSFDFSTVWLTANGQESQIP